MAVECFLPEAPNGSPDDLDNLEHAFYTDGMIPADGFALRANEIHKFAAHTRMLAHADKPHNREGFVPLRFAGQIKLEITLSDILILPPMHYAESKAHFIFGYKISD